MKSIVVGFSLGMPDLILLFLVLVVFVIAPIFIIRFVIKAAKKTDIKDQQSSAPPVIETKQDS